ncbi:hypothetical protein [Variovorax sp. YR634]|uniref:hypothetical protein n=1 Tax=Variovorax sp. YR634 TaxID=1884385 RepID=UPI00115FF0AE|nr:hypothetical protein [Variovorax sp. YR634]
MAEITSSIKEAFMHAAPEHHSLYEFSGNIADVNTMLVGRDELRALQAAIKDRDAEIERLKKDAQQASAPKALVICGENPTPIDADLVGCGTSIDRLQDVYRCTDCGVPFHRACAIRHFVSDTPEHSAEVFKEQLRRVDAIDAMGKDGAHD